MPLRIQVLSDLHLDCHYDRLDIPKTDADVIILAGDIAEGLDGIKWVIKQAKRLKKTIIYVLGNHEYYNHDSGYLDDQIKQAVVGNPFIHVLQMNHLTIGKYRILGTTLWTSFELESHSDRFLNQLKAGVFLNDYRVIQWFGQRLTPERTRLWHITQRLWLEDQLKLAQLEALIPIVVTHHAPHPRSISDRYIDSPLNPAFASDLSELFEQPWSAPLWIHGHMHEVVDYEQGSTRVLANPRGYPGEVSSSGEFEWDKIVELE